MKRKGLYKPRYLSKTAVAILFENENESTAFSGCYDKGHCYDFFAYLPKAFYTYSVFSFTWVQRRDFYSSYNFHFLVG